jgi:hypothetical protein
MSKTVWTPQNALTIPVQQNATTASPQAVTVISGAPKLQAITHCVVFEDQGKTVRVYRRSTTAPDTLSCDVHRRQADGTWTHREEDRKYKPGDTLFPPGAREIEVEGVRCASLDAFTDEAINFLRRLLRGEQG